MRHWTAISLNKDRGSYQQGQRSPGCPQGQVYNNSCLQRCVADILRLKKEVAMVSGAPQQLTVPPLRTKGIPSPLPHVPRAVEQPWIWSSLYWDCPAAPPLNLISAHGGSQGLASYSDLSGSEPQVPETAFGSQWGLEDTPESAHSSTAISGRHYKYAVAYPDAAAVSPKATTGWVTQAAWHSADAVSGHALARWHVRMIAQSSHVCYLIFMKFQNNQVWLTGPLTRLHTTYTLPIHYCVTMARAEEEIYMEQINADFTQNWSHWKASKMWFSLICHM